jgi:hypothetical protein
MKTIIYIIILIYLSAAVMPLILVLLTFKLLVCTAKKLYYHLRQIRKII